MSPEMSLVSRMPRTETGESFLDKAKDMLGGLFGGGGSAERTMRPEGQRMRAAPALRVRSVGRVFVSAPRAWSSCSEPMPPYAREGETEVER